MGLWLLCFAALLMGCARSDPPPRMIVETKIERLRVPPVLLDCALAPPLPTPEATQRAVGLFIVDLWAAWADCRAKLAAVKKLNEE